MSVDRELLNPLARLRRWGLLAAVVFGALSAAGAWTEPEDFYPAYLVGYLFWLGISLGSLALAMIHSLTGGAWGVVIRRVLESAMATLPLMALLFLPLPFGLAMLYPWANASTAAHDPLLQVKSRYLDVDFFTARAAVYFVIWVLLALAINRFSRFESSSGDERRTAEFRLARISAPGLVLFGLTATFAAFDWSMSLEPHWYSTMYGVMLIGGYVLAGLSFSLVAAILVSRFAPWSALVSRERWRDLGNLLLALLMFWAYVSYMQFLIIWSGNLPEEVVWYQRRSGGTWQIVVAVLMVLHFGVPFLALLMRSVKRNPRRLLAVAAWLLTMRYVDLFWLIKPAFHSEGVVVHWLDLTVMLAVGGLWLATFAWRLGMRATLPNYPLESAHAASEPAAGAMHGT